MVDRLQTMRPVRRLGLRGLGARLLLAFAGICALGGLAAGTAIHAFREVSGQLATVEARVDPALAALKLSRTAERIVAGAPALLAAPDLAAREAVRVRLDREQTRLAASLAELRAHGLDEQTLAGIAAPVAALEARLKALDRAVTARAEARQTLGDRRQEVARLRGETTRLLDPWLAVLDAETARAIETADSKLEARVAAQRDVRAARRAANDVLDLLIETASGPNGRRLDVLAFQMARALAVLDEASARLDPRLATLMQGHAGELRALADGPDALTAARRAELAAGGRAEAELEAAGRIAAALTAAVDTLGTQAGVGVERALAKVAAVQRASTHWLIAVVAVSVIASALLAWLYVGRNLVGRLTALSGAMRAIANGRMATPVAVKGRDEVAEMGRAVELFRLNAVELDRLLAERTAEGERLERLVAERTKALSAKTRELERANGFQAQFIAAAGHDLRQPLHALNLYVARLSQTGDGDQRSLLLARIDAAVAAMNELFDSLLDMAKLEAGAIHPTVGTAPLARLFDRLETTFAQEAERKGLRLRVVATRHWVRSDPVLLERLLQNLLSNAIRATEAGGVLLGARLDGRTLAIEVRDTGPGLPAERRRALFEDGGGQATAGTGLSGGLGLGLGIVRRLAQLLGHKLTVSTAAGHGTCIRVRVPIAPAQATPQRAAATAHDPLAGVCVLAIDDDPLALDALAGTLTAWGCTVLRARGPTAARAALAAGPAPDVIVSDDRLGPAADGITLIDELRRQLRREVPALLIGADTAPEPERAARAAGLTLLRKPVSPMGLRAAIGAARQRASGGAAVMAESR